MGKVRFRKEVPLMELRETPIVGKLYHVSWGWSRGIVGKCVQVDELAQLVKLITPKTKVAFQNLVKFKDLRYTRSDQARILKDEKEKKRSLD